MKTLHQFLLEKRTEEEARYKTGDSVHRETKEVIGHSKYGNYPIHKSEYGTVTHHNRLYANVKWHHDSSQTLHKQSDGHERDTEHDRKSEHEPRRYIQHTTVRSGKDLRPRKASAEEHQKYIHDYAERQKTAEV